MAALAGVGALAGGTIANLAASGINLLTSVINFTNATLKIASENKIATGVIVTVGLVYFKPEWVNGAIDRLADNKDGIKKFVTTSSTYMEENAAKPLRAITIDKVGQAYIWASSKLAEIPFFSTAAANKP